MKNKLTSKEIRKKARKRIRALGGGHRSFVHLTCKKCKREYKIMTNDKEAYTEKIKKNYICLLCR